MMVREQKVGNYIYADVRDLPFFIIFRTFDRNGRLQL